MRYLSFDIECCDGQHICEFGYVLADEQFNVLKKDFFIINPEKPFKLTGRPQEDDLTLCFQEETYYAGFTFPHYYEKIKELLTFEDQIIIGHALSNDAGFLRNACREYKLDPINFSFFDTQKAYALYTNEKSRISLETAGEQFHLDKPSFLHKSDDDALLTLQMMKKLCELSSASLSEMKVLYPTANGCSHNFNIMYTGNSLPEMLEALAKNPDALSNKRKEMCLKQFAKNVKANAPIKNSKLSGSKLCFSSSFEKYNFKDTLVLIQMLANYNCHYNMKMSENEYYVATQEELDSTEINERTRYYSALHNKEKEHTVITFDELYEILSTSEAAVKESPWPQIEKKKPRIKEYSTGSASNTIGEQLKAKGIDLSKFLKK